MFDGNIRIEINSLKDKLVHFVYPTLHNNCIYGYIANFQNCQKFDFGQF